MFFEVDLETTYSVDGVLVVELEPFYDRTKLYLTDPTHTDFITSSAKKEFSYSYVPPPEDDQEDPPLFNETQYDPLGIDEVEEQPANNQTRTAVNNTDTDLNVTEMVKVTGGNDAKAIETLCKLAGY